ncbi:MAG: flagellar hook-length control protein FliK [Oleiphilaceae bacterium]|nr:flagellar hook-length control protein FliK [Oleiphilaceae bacterium]
MVTRLSDTGPPPTPTDGLRNQRPASAQTALPVEANLRQLPAGKQLDLLQLQNRETALARVAQILNNRQGAGDQAILDIRGQRLLVQAAVGDTRLDTGDWVKVMRANNELQLMGKLAPAAETRISQALAQRLPWQQRLDVGLNELARALNTDNRPQVGASTKPAPLPVAAKEAIQQLMTLLPSSKSLAATTATPDTTAQQIKTWIAQSGLFAEGRVAGSPDKPPPDLKLALGRIVAALLPATSATATAAEPAQFNRYTPLVSPELVQAPLQFPNQLPPPPPSGARDAMDAGQMLRVLAGMLNRISVNQLHSQVLSSRAPAEGAAPVAQLIELPWVNAHNEARVAQLRLEHDRAEDKAEDSAGRKAARVAEWRFSLALDLDEQGSVFFEVSLRDVQVSARVWAENQDTLRQAREDMATLRSRFNALGLDVVGLECRRGSPQGSATRLEQRLVDTKA